MFSYDHCFSTKKCQYPKNILSWGHTGVFWLRGMRWASRNWVPTKRCVSLWCIHSQYSFNIFCWWFVSFGYLVGWNFFLSSETGLWSWAELIWFRILLVFFLVIAKLSLTVSTDWVALYSLVVCLFARLHGYISIYLVMTLTETKTYKETKTKTKTHRHRPRKV